MANKSISQLDSAVAVTNEDLFETAIPDQGSATGYASKKHSMAVMANHIGTEVSYPALSTTAKTLVNAINEAAQAGGTTVIANPVGTPTDDLDTIQIGSTIYDIVGSGGGGGLPYAFYEITTLTNGSVDSTRGGCWFIKYGNVVHLHLSVKDLTAETSTEVYTMPAGSRPPQVTAMGIGIGADRTTTASASVGASSGKINLWSESTTALIDMEYIVNDQTGGGVAEGIFYSTTERVAGVWIDGSPLYEKTLVITSNGEYTHSIANINQVIDCVARVIRSDGACIPIPTYNNSSYYGYIVATKTIVNVYVNGTNWQPTASNPCYVTMRYTKTS